MKKMGLIAGAMIMVLLAGCGANDAGEAETAVSGSTGGEVQQEVELPIAPTGAEKADIYVEAVDNISDEFARGVDISTIIAEEAAGAKYYNTDGVEEDVFKILSDAGVNYVRVRIWNDPYDADGHGYGGGNCDVNNAVNIAVRAAEYNMKMFVDFHYSDFWADPKKQMVPKAWAGMSASEKADAAYEFTLDALEKITEAGGDIGMVQVGNETNNGMSGETSWNNVVAIMNGGSKAVREVASKYNKEIKVCAHFTDPQDPEKIDYFAGMLKGMNLDYDVFALSYYPYWHGTLDNLKTVMSNLTEKYGKEVMVAETAYMWDEGDGDNNGNSVGSDDVVRYPATYVGQAVEVRDVCAAVNEVGGIGVFYWEPAWVPVDSSTWEQGSGWATSYAGEYDPNDAGKYYGGSSWDNQAMFDYTGKALPSINVWKYLKYGTECDFEFEYLESVEAPALERKEVSNNLILNSSFEEEDRSGWELKGETPFDYQKKAEDAFSGDFAMHYWSAGDVRAIALYSIADVEPGTYTFGCYTQGGDAGSDAEMYIFVTDGQTETDVNFMTDGWVNWQNPEIWDYEVTETKDLTVGVYVQAGAGAWGTFDDFYFFKQ